MKIAILTSPGQWFENYAKKLSEKLADAPVYLEHTKINNSYDIVFILSYHRLIDREFLLQHKHNIVIHESDLPLGKGWAPLFWQILEGKNEIVFTMFEAADGVDNGDVYMKKTLQLNGTELNEELRKKRADLTIQMCQEFIKQYDTFKQPKPQTGSESFYPKRTAQDSELDINKTIKEQFNLLRIVDNDSYPAFFELDGHRYRLAIELGAAKGGQLIDFVDLSYDERLMILEMRNHPKVREWMYTQDKIQPEQHFGFIESLIDNKQNQYLAVKQNEKLVGVVYFNQIDLEEKTAYFGLYANLFEPVRGVGRLLEKLSIFYAKNILRLKALNLEVFAKNKPVSNLHNKYGFIETERLQKNGVEVISMSKSL